MEQGFIDVLKQLIHEQTNAALTDARKCKALLADYTKNEYKKESRLLLQAVEAGAAKAIDGADDLVACKKAKIRELEEEYHLSPAFAAEAVNALALVLRGDTTITVSPSTEKEAAERAAAEKPVVTKPVIEKSADQRSVAPSFNTDDKIYMKVGTLGHVDHGKTTLSSAISMYCSMQYGGSAMKYNEIEKLHCFEYRSGKRHYAHTDFNDTITGLAQMGGAILVVSAPDSVMPQTREHIELASQANIPLIVFMNKLDLLDDPALLELVVAEIEDALITYGFPDGYKIPIIRGSAYYAMQDLEQGRNTNNTACIKQLLDAMDANFPLRS